MPDKLNLNKSPVSKLFEKNQKNVLKIINNKEYRNMSKINIKKLQSYQKDKINFTHNHTTRRQSMLVSTEFEGTLADVSDQIHEYSDPKTLKMNISACFDNSRPKSFL